MPFPAMVIHGRPYNLRTSWKTLRVLWFALVVSQLLFLFMLWMTRWGPQVKPLKLHPDPTMFTVLAAVAVGPALLSWVVPLVSFRRGAGSAPAPPPGQPLPPQLMQPLMPIVQTCFILAWALSEAVSLFGFTLAFLGFPPSQVWPFFAVGIGMTVIRFPGEHWVRLALR